MFCPLIKDECKKNKCMFFVDNIGRENCCLNFIGEISESLDEISTHLNNIDKFGIKNNGD